VRLVEIEDSETESDTYVIWCDSEICEERDDDETTVTRRAFAQGEQVGGTSHYFARDQLGSVREVLDGSEALLARYAYDPWGRRNLTEGNDETSLGFGGYRVLSSVSSVHISLYRAYDAALGRWLSEDPIKMADGTNLLMFVRNGPVTFTDWLGLLSYKPGVPPATGPLLGLLNCIQKCVGRDLRITSTTEERGPNTPHGRGVAADITWDPDADFAKKLLCCAARCGAGYGLDEGRNPSSRSTGPHFHVQLPPGLRGGRGDLPCKECQM
jgi:RHS repeat-associated protein